MYRQTTTITPATPNFPLAPLWVGQGSAALVLISGVPAGATAALILTPVGGGTALSYGSTVSETTGEVSVYVAGWAFPTAGQTQYEITLTTGEGDTEAVYWAGKGLLSVWAASTVADIPAAPAIPTDRYLYVPADGKYHLLSGDLDPVTGMFTCAMGQEGYATVPEGGTAI